MLHLYKTQWLLLYSQQKIAMTSIALIMAMDEEASPIVKALSLEPKGYLCPPLPMRLYQGEWHGKQISLVVSGKCKRYGVDHIGPQGATVSTLKTIEVLSPSIIINAGTAGGFVKAGAAIGDVYLSFPYVCFHDRRVALPGFDRYGVGEYTCMDTRELASKLNLKLGVITTGSSLDITDSDISIMNSYKGIVKEMEAAAIAWVAEMYQVPFMAIKSITDLVDTETPTEEEFLKNLSLASEKLSKEVIKLLGEV